MPSSSAAKPVITLNLKDRDALYASYMPFLNEGGLFIPTERPYEIGDELIIQLQLPNEPDELQVRGRVVWLSPRSTSGRPAGVGIHFGDKSLAARRKVETLLAPLMKSGRPTYTL